MGVCRKEDVFYAKAAGVGNPVIYVGARTGRDGIHGASMASAEFTEESKQKRPNVQVGDPFMEKLLLEACLEAMQTGAIVGIQDMGAAGLTCSTCEMGSRGGVGIEIELDRVPQRETGMTPYEIMLSESQERMLLVAEKGREEEVYRVFRKWGLEAAEIGVVTDDGKLRVRHHGQIVAEIPNRELADEAPLYHRPYTRPPQRPEAPVNPRWVSPAGCAARADGERRHLFQALDLGAVRLPSAHQHRRRARRRSRDRTHQGNGNLRGDFARWQRPLFATSIRAKARNWLWPNAAATWRPSGALPVAATNNLELRQSRAARDHGATRGSDRRHVEACRFFETPITGGNVSLYNETLGEGIYPTPVMGIVGTLPTAAPVTIPFKNKGRAVMLIGGAGACNDLDFGGTRIRQGDPEAALGTAAGARYGLRKARA